MDIGFVFVSYSEMEGLKMNFRNLLTQPSMYVTESWAEQDLKHAYVCSSYY